jgi:hypothetical protein
MNINATIVRPLEMGDLPRLQTPGTTKAPALKSLSLRHHRLARALAEGIAPGEAGVICGYQNSRVSILQADPAFKQLVRMYRTQVDAQFIGMQERLAEIASSAADIISDRLEENPDSFEVGDLTKLVSLGADRTGNGPSNTVKHEVSMGARLDAARQRLRDRADNIVDAVVLPSPQVKDDLA